MDGTHCSIHSNELIRGLDLHCFAFVCKKCRINRHCYCPFLSNDNIKYFNSKFNKIISKGCMFTNVIAIRNKLNNWIEQYECKCANAIDTIKKKMEPLFYEKALPNLKWDNVLQWWEGNMNINIESEYDSLNKEISELLTAIKSEVILKNRRINKLKWLETLKMQYVPDAGIGK